MDPSYFFSLKRPIGSSALLVLSLLFAACTGREALIEDRAVLTTAVGPSHPIPGQMYFESGTASWYGRELHQNKTASGEVFDQEGLSAAHRTLPFGTMLRVTNLENAKSIKVRVNDRGPFIKSRMLALSYGAARELDFVAKGTARVSIETLESVQHEGRYTVQAALYGEEENAKALKRRLSKKFELIFIAPIESNRAHYFAVRVGSYLTVERAEQTAGKLQLEGLEPVVLRKD